MVLKSILKKIIPKPLWELAKFIDDPRDDICMMSFLFRGAADLSFAQRLSWLYRFYRITANINCQHTQCEMLCMITALLNLPVSKEGCIVEAGTYKGGSAAKFSMAAKQTGRELLLFDSFEGIPRNEELMSDGRPYHPEGSWCGALAEVRSNLDAYGEINSCEFKRGWFDDTLPAFNRPIALIYLDVDLASSTRTCLKYLYPLLIPGGVLFSHDGHLPPVKAVYGDEKFWEEEVGIPRPRIEGLGERKLLKIVKPER